MNVITPIIPKTKLDYALNWAARGFAVFPLAPNSKEPLEGLAWKEAATTDPETIRALWTNPQTGKPADYNIAYVPDRAHCVVDLDVKNGREGIANYRALGGVIGGFVVRTPTGGLHVYLKGHNVACGDGKVAEGIDVKASGAGYVVAPGSTIDGEAYEVIEAGEMLTVPRFVVDKVGTYSDRPEKAGFVHRDPDDSPANLARAVAAAKRHEKATTGRWHALGFTLGAEMARIGVSFDLAYQIAHDHWALRGVGLTDVDRLRADLLGGYDRATKDGEFGRNAAGDPADLCGHVKLIPASPDHAVLDAASVARQSTLAELSTTGRRQDVAPTQDNVARILKGDALLRGLVALDEFSGRLLIGRSPPALRDLDGAAPGPYPRELRDSDETRILAYLHQSWGADFGGAMLTAALRVEAEDNRFHPVRRWLETLAWDGVPRLDSWLCRVFGAADAPYTRAVGAKMLIAAVRRVRTPGCKFDYLPVLAGGQGIGKSSALAVLFGRNWFTDHLHEDLSSREAAMGLAGVWAVELSEITQLVRSRAETAKAFLSRSVDRYRVPYARNAVDVPRQCILIGTTNADSFLVDATGNRRYWPIQCGAAPADLAWLGAHRAQLWAEAARREAGGESVWLDDTAIRQAAEAAQDAVYEVDPWQDRIAARLGTQPVRIPELMTHALSLPAAQQGKTEQGRVAAILRRLGWVRRNGWDRAAGKAAWMWHPPEGWQATRPGAAFDPFAGGASPPGAGGGEVGGEAVTV